MPLSTATPMVLTDPGFLFIANLASTLPPMAALASTYDADVWPVAWVPVGATEDGSQFSYEMTIEPITVAELFNPISYAPTGVATSISFAMADFTLHKLRRAMNASTGSVTTASGTGATLSSKLSPPGPTAIVRQMIGWESLDHTLRMIGYQALNGGAMEISWKRAPDKATIATTWNFEQPLSGDSFNFWAAGTGRLGV